MTSTATNRSAALAGVWSAGGGFAYAAVAEHFSPSYAAVLWWVNLAVLAAIFFVPFFRWVIGANVKPDGKGLTIGEHWSALPEQYSRIGIYFLSASAVGVCLGLLSRVVS